MVNKKSAARRSCINYAPTVVSAKKDSYSIPDEWERGCTNAGILLVLMFVVLTLGAWWFGW